MLSYPQAAARRQVAAPTPPWAAGGGAVVAVPKHLPNPLTHLSPLTRTSPDPLPPT